MSNHMPSLYQEAIADAKALKEMAERNAKNKIVEAITPRIRQLIESQLLSEEEQDQDAPNLDLDPLPDDVPSEADLEAQDLPPAPSAPPSSPTAPMPPAPVSNVQSSSSSEDMKHTISTETPGGAKIKMTVAVEEQPTGEEDEAVELSKEGLEALADMILGENRSEPTPADLRAGVTALKRLLPVISLTESANFHAAYSILVQDANRLRGHIISNDGSSADRAIFNNAIKEMKKMSNSAKFRRLIEEMQGSRRTANEAKIVFDTMDLQGLDDPDFKEKLKGLSFGVEFDEESEMPPVEAAPPVAPAAADAAAAPPVAEGDDYEMDEDVYEMDDSDEDIYEGDEDEMDENVYEIDESVLRRELRRLRTLREGKKGIDDAMADQFGGGKEDGDPWLDGEVTTEGVESDDSEEETDEAKKVAAKALDIAKKATEAAKSEKSARMEESRKNRNLVGQLKEAESVIANLRTQLEETNLFNAKLLYVNKLMQNRDLTPRQQRAIVESLDAAKTIREAKLLYTSLTESVKTKSGSINEARNLGSSSRSTKSGSTLNESVEADRWAVLAGIRTRS